MKNDEHIASRRAKAVEMYLAGEMPGRIAATVGYSEQHVRDILRRSGAMPVGASAGATPARGNGRPPKADRMLGEEGKEFATPHAFQVRQRQDRYAAIVELHGRGLEPGQIAGRVGLGELTVRRCLANENLHVPSGQGWPRKPAGKRAAKGKRVAK